MVYWEVAEGPPRALAPSSTARSLSSEAKSDGMTDPDWERIASRFGMPEGTAVALGLAPNPQAAPGADDSAARKLQDIVQRAKHALVSYDTLPPEDEHIAAPSADGEVSSMRELMDKMMTDFGRRAKQRERALDNVEVSARDLATASSREAVAHEVEGAEATLRPAPTTTSKPRRGSSQSRQGGNPPWERVSTPRTGRLRSTLTPTTARSSKTN